MSVQARRLANGVAYYAVYMYMGRQVWEHAGRDKREAERLERRRRAEIERGTFQPKTARRMTVGEYLEAWAAQRTNRNAAREFGLLDRHVVGRPNFASLRLADLRPHDMVAFIESLKETTSEETGALLSPKHVRNIYGLVRTALRDARMHEVIDSDPCEPVRFKLPKVSSAPRTIYDALEIAALTSAFVAPDARIWNALALFTGMRCGEVCGRRWRDLDLGALLLSSLHVHTQYTDRILKTERPRIVPVHAKLRRALEWWRAVGFEFVYARKPTSDDFIVPRRVDAGANAHTESSAYKQWMRSCSQSGVANRTVHSTRHTFITFARRGGAAKDVLERITHNAKGDIVDQYTHFDWAPLCAVVDALTRSLTEIEISLDLECRRRESKPRHITAIGDTSSESSESEGDEPPSKSREIAEADAEHCASQCDSPLVAAARGLARERAAWAALDAFEYAAGAE